MDNQQAPKVQHADTEGSLPCKKRAGHFGARIEMSSDIECFSALGLAYWLDEGCIKSVLPGSIKEGDGRWVGIIDFSLL